MRFCITTLGCKVNQYESQAMERVLCERGHTTAVMGEGVDVCILNTCAVTAESERKSRHIIRRMKKLEPAALVAVCGCYSQLEPDAVRTLGVELVGGAGDRLGFVTKVEELWDSAMPSTQKGQKNDSAIQSSPSQSPPVTFEELPPGNTASRTRALLKIQDGCNNFCTYCIVPYIRGRSRSLPLERVVEYAAQLEKQGYKEIVATGIELASYGLEIMKQNTREQQCDTKFPRSKSHCPGMEKMKQSTCPPASLAFVAISNAAPSTRLRLGSLSPSLITEEFCREISKIPNLCNHFHISLQSGCDETLKRMGRKYTANQVYESIKSIRKHFDINGELCGITADLIVGFPGETDEEFAQTLAFIEKAGFSDMHIFPYSIRPGTKATEMPGQIEKDIKKERARMAAIITNKNTTKFKTAHIGKTITVLFEQEKTGISKGHSSNYLEVTVKEKVKQNSIKKVKIISYKNNVLTGEIV